MNIMENPLSFIVLVVTGCLFQLCISFEGISDEGQVGYWPLDDGSGEIVEDASGNGNDGEIEGEAEWVEGICGGALELRAENKAKVRIPNDPILCVTEQITLCAWIKPISIYEGNDWTLANTVIGKRLAYYLTINTNGNLASWLAQPEVYLGGDADMSRYIGDWVHVATTYDGSELVLYVNGKRDAAMPRNGLIAITGDDLYLGYVAKERYIDGAIDEAMVWTRALSEEEIKHLITVSQAVTPKGKLAASWGEIKEALKQRNQSFQKKL